VLDERLVEGAADELDALVVEVLRVRPGQLPGLLLDQRPGLAGRVRRPEELVDRAEVDRHGEHLALVAGVDAVDVVRESREAVDVLPDPLVGGVEQVRAVAVHLDPGPLLVLRVGVAADVGPAVDQGDGEAQFVGGPLGHGQAEEA
jgi:hypothetical protein